MARPTSWYRNTFEEVFHATAAGSAQYGVVGVENSTEGVVNRTLDMFRNTPCHIVGEVSLLIRHHLLRSTDDAGRHRGRGSPTPRRWRNAKPGCPSTCRTPSAARSKATPKAPAWPPCNPTWAGIASERAAQQFGLHIVSHAIQDDAYNRTRFAIICLPHTLATPAPTGKDCTSLVISVPNRPGAVHDLLVPLKTHGVSMTRFESRPARTGQWEYYFYIDLEGHPAQPHVAAALSELQALSAFYKVLGTYPTPA